MSEIRFSSKEHEKFFYQMLAKCGKHDSYYLSLIHILGDSLEGELTDDALESEDYELLSDEDLEEIIQKYV